MNPYLVLHETASLRVGLYDSRVDIKADFYNQNMVEVKLILKKLGEK